MKTRRSAFTLLEIMLAVTILGLLVIAVSSTWSAGLRGWKRSSGLTETFQRQRIVMDSLTELLQSAVYFQGRNNLYAFITEHNPSGGDSLSFVTASDALLPPCEIIAAGMRRVTITLDDRSCLVIQNAPALQEPDLATPQTWHVLTSGVTEFSMRFRNTQTDGWKDSWEPADGMPSGLLLTVTFAPLETRDAPVVLTRMVDLPTAKLSRSYQTDPAIPTPLAK